MAKLTDEKIQEAFAPHLQSGEELRYWAYGVKQPHILAIVLLTALAVLPGLIAIVLLTRHYLIGLTGRRFLVLRIKSMGNPEVQEVAEYALDELPTMDVKTSTGALFTHIRIKDDARPFVAKFHRAFSKNNRPHAMAIAEAVTGGAAA